MGVGSVSNDPNLTTPLLLTLNFSGCPFESLNLTKNAFFDPKFVKLDVINMPLEEVNSPPIIIPLALILPEAVTCWVASSPNNIFTPRALKFWLFWPYIILSLPLL